MVDTAMKPSVIPPPAPWTGRTLPGGDGEDLVTDRFLRWIGGGLIAAHGLVHLMGWQLLWKLGEPGQLTYADATPTPGTADGYFVGTMWMLAALLFVAAALLLVDHRVIWRRVAVGGVVLSAAVIALSPAQSAVGLMADGLVLIGVAATVYPQRKPNRPAER
jgi:hypothetical protein